MVQFTGSSCSPDTMVKSVQINSKLEKSPKSDSQRGISSDERQDNTGTKLHTVQQLTNIGALRNNSSPILQQRTNIPPGPRYSAPCDKNDVTLGKSSPLRIVSFNIKGFNSNRNHFDELLDKHDIVLLQEHWLFNYEKELLKQHHSDFITFQDKLMIMNPYPQPVDQKDMDVLQYCTESPCRPCSLNFLMEYRIQATTKDPICLINVYLPSRGTDKGHGAF
ncbi:unnamed protein product [Mytilus coruscus]|uniref:Endonuclease/exonuclease/phosphatase domain-containing protein n=1 Tax=Mytilus coruscus TaxID=42192 RepID=A0A6J8EY54_MYTCO|nr:unnamed protein product [Mytilus coruscus]